MATGDIDGRTVRNRRLVGVDPVRYRSRADSSRAASIADVSGLRRMLAGRPDPVQ